MTDLQQLASICLTGRVGDLPARPTPDEVERALGDGYLDVWDRKHRFLRRDYGVVEFHFFRADDLRCRTVGIQLHRLKDNPQALSRSEIGLLGDVSGGVAWTDLARTIEEANGALPGADVSQSGFARFHFPDSGVEVFVGAGAGNPSDDRVWAIVATFGD